MVFYFSATGNSRYVAEKAAAEFGMDTVDITAALRRGQFSYEAGGGEKIIFVMPCTSGAFRLPSWIFCGSWNLPAHQRRRSASY